MNYEQTNVQRIVSWLRRGEKTEENVQIGVETEHFVIDRSTGKSIGYEGSPGVFDLLQKLSAYYDTQVFVDGFLMGVKRKDCYITLEPAAQLELSIGTRKSIAAVETCYDRFYAESMRELEKNNLTLATIGYQPRSKISELMMIPKRRYACMSEYLPAKGQHALNMMKGTASTQVSLDYISEADFAEKFRIANCLAPTLCFLTDNAPVFEGHLYTEGMLRSRIWDDVDSARCGIVPGALDGPFGYEAYARYLLDCPCILAQKGEEVLYEKEKPFGDALSDVPMSDEEIAFAMGMVFPDVRARQYLEIRVADSMPKEYMLAYAALLKGLFYSNANRRKLTELFAHETDASIETQKKRLYDQGSNAEVFGKNIYEFLVQLFAMARESLDTEARYLLPLEQLVAAKQKVYDADAMRKFLFVKNFVK